MHRSSKLHWRRRSRGQSLVEFALILPLLLFVMAFGLDFGRVFLGWVSLNNSVRVAANYAAQNPTAWGIPPNPAVQAQYTAVKAEYQRLVRADAGAINCVLPVAIPDPTFINGTGIGEPAKVGITCTFPLITPILSNVLGSGVAVSATSAFPIRSGVIAGIPIQTAVPTATPTATPVPTPTAGPTPTPTATPNPNCTAPNLVGLMTNKAPQAWLSAGFSGPVTFSPLVPPQYKIGQQLPLAASVGPCSGGILVKP